MSEDKKRPEDEQFSLEELNQQFLKDIKKKKRKKYKEIPLIWMVILLAAVVLIVVVIVWKVADGTQSTGGSAEDATTMESDADSTGTEKETYNESTLSEEEQEKWAGADPDGENIYVELNSKIYLDGNKAYIRLINPIYSAYYYSITVYPEGEEETILYQSERIAPGTILEAGMLTAEPTEEQYHAVVTYRVYDEEGTELGTHSVNVEFTTDEQYK